MSTTITQTKIEKMKREAKEMRKRDGVPHRQALDKVAQQHGYAHWHQVADQFKGGANGR